MSDFLDKNNAELQRGTFFNPDTGIEVHFYRKAMEETISKANDDRKQGHAYKAVLSAVYQLPEIIDNAICLDTQLSEYNDKTAKNKSPNTLFMHRMYCVLSYKGEPYLANIAVQEQYNTEKGKKEITGTENSIYCIKGIRIAPIETLGLQAHAYEPHGKRGFLGATSTLSIPQLCELVKRYDQNFTQINFQKQPSKSSSDL